MPLKKHITESQKEYLLANYSSLSADKLGENMGVSDTKILRWLSEMGIRKARVWKRLDKVPVEESGLFEHDKTIATI